MTHLVPKGFRLAGVACGIKRNSQKKDLALIVCDRDSVAAGVYTQNIVQAASVVQNRAKTPGDRFRAVLINSGNANACTGQRGEQDTRQMAQLAAHVCQADAEQALVMSTGIIGRYLPMDNIARGVEAAASRLADQEQALLDAAAGMMTTDQFIKVATRETEIDGRSFRVAGIAKGAGMIGPQMATMLAVIMTDAPLAVADAQQLLQSAADVSFNCISVEGHTSTNDTVLLLASGAAGGPVLAGDQLAQLQGVVTELCQQLAKMIPDDGEGAAHCITIDVGGCASVEAARQIAKTVATSPLVKTAIAGADPNWGRIVSAAGYAGVPFDPGQLELSINGTLVFQHGGPVDFDAAAVSNSIRQQREVVLQLSLAEGVAGARFWTSDLTVEYVRFNSEYST